MSCCFPIPLVITSRLMKSHDNSFKPMKFFVIFVHFMVFYSKLPFIISLQQFFGPSYCIELNTGFENCQYVEMSLYVKQNIIELMLSFVHRLCFNFEHLGTVSLIVIQPVSQFSGQLKSIIMAYRF